MSVEDFDAIDHALIYWSGFWPAYKPPTAPAADAKK
jgi:hypothetical protein